MSELRVVRGPILLVWAIGMAAAVLGDASAQDSEMVAVPAGWFTMGATAEQRTATLEFGWPERWRARIATLVDSAAPAHRIYLDDFAIDRHEVTNRDYRDFVLAAGFPAPAFWGQRRHLSAPEQPVVGVSWFEAAAYCSWAGKRLPTEAEWEKAAHGAELQTYPWGDTWDRTRLRNADSSAGVALADFSAWRAWQQASTSDRDKARPADVGSHPNGASPYGVMDMSGNVWEWVADWYHAEYYADTPSHNPAGPSKGARKVLRGGGWDVPRVIATTWFRENVFPPHARGSTVTGLRCARDPIPEADENDDETLDLARGPE